MKSVVQRPHAQNIRRWAWNLPLRLVRWRCLLSSAGIHPSQCLFSFDFLKRKLIVANAPCNYPWLLPWPCTWFKMTKLQLFLWKYFKLASFENSWLWGPPIKTVVHFCVSCALVWSEIQLCNTKRVHWEAQNSRNSLEPQFRWISWFISLSFLELSVLKNLRSWLLLSTHKKTIYISGFFKRFFFLHFFSSS